MRRLLLLLPTNTYRASDFLAAATRLDVVVAVGSNKRQTLEHLSDGGTVTLDFHNLDRGVDEIVAYARDHPLAAIVSADDAGAVLAARASGALGLPHNSAASVAATRDKHRMRAALKAAGLPTPDFAVFPVSSDPEDVARRVSYPCVLKPLALAASRGVIRANDATEFAAAFARIARLLATPELAGTDASLDRILVEDFIPGREVALEAMLEDGTLTPLAVFDKPDPLDGPFFEETIYVTPSRLADARQKDIVDMAGRAATALGLRHGPVHAEFRLNDDGVWPLEIAARSIGGLCSRSLRFGVGVGLEDLILRHALGLSPVAQAPVTKAPDRQAAGVMMIPIPRAGILGAVGGIAAAKAIAGIEEVTITIPPGAAVTPLPEGDRYLGFIFARADRPEDAEAALRAAHASLTISIEPARATVPQGA